MTKIFDFSSFSSINESDDGSTRYGLEQISSAFNSFGDDLVEVFYVVGNEDNAISFSESTNDDTAEITAYISDEPDCYFYDYDFSALEKLLKWAFEDTEGSNLPGPKFTLKEIMEAAKEVIVDDKYVSTIDISDAYVDLTVRDYKNKNEVGMIVTGEIKDISDVKVKEVNGEALKKDIIDRLVNRIIGASDFSY